MVVAGLLAFVLVLAVLRDRGATVAVAVASRDLPAGVAIGPDDVRMVEIPADSALRTSLVGAARLGDGRRWITAHALTEGEALTTSTLATPGAPGGLRAMSIAVAREHAAGGQLSAGDVVDVIDVASGRAEFVVRGAPVLGVASSGARHGLGDVGGAFYVTVGVDSDAALRLAAALANGKVEVLRATGAADIGTNAAGAGSIR